ncbi:MAG: diguanylate cyclase [Methylococcaceae bacterium]|nr:diguanylate cyclase [Methylococcaceae bacterium]
MKSIYHKILAEINVPENALVFAKIRAVIDPHAEDIVHSFYRIMLTDKKAILFINSDLVKHRLKASLINWINIAFLYRETEKEQDAYLKYQLEIGLIHGRIDLPISLVNYGMYLIKNKIVELLLHSKLNRQELNKATLLSSQVLDCALGLMNESYQGELIINEKESEAFKLQFSTHNLAFDCERLRTSLSDWMRELLFTIQQEQFDVDHLPTIRHSNFGLWVTHKAKLFLINRTEYIELVQLLDDIDEILLKLKDGFKDLEQRKILLKELNMFVSKSIWLLGDIAKEIIEKDNGRDSLTRLFNRRYLETVLRHETECSMQSGLIFGVLVVDIDFFKKINDNYGHDNGDKVLVQIAEVLTNEVRAGDFVFRLGGEEFLIVLGDINSKVIMRAAEKICLAVEKTAFHLNDKQSLSVTVSVGTAIHDGHPDFNRTVKLADTALYEAKNNGRNRVVAANQSALTYAEIMR